MTFQDRANNASEKAGSGLILFNDPSLVEHSEWLLLAPDNLMRLWTLLAAPVVLAIVAFNRRRHLLLFIMSCIGSYYLFEVMRIVYSVVNFTMLSRSSVDVFELAIEIATYLAIMVLVLPLATLQLIAKLTDARPKLARH